MARHRLLRRGRVYGPASPAAVDARRTPDDANRGFLFIAVNASIRRQFEFIQQTWINNPKFAGLHHERDPLVASARDEEASFTIQGRPVHRRLQKLPQLVQTRGGAYYFMPGLQALDWLARRGA